VGVVNKMAAVVEVRTDIQVVDLLEQRTKVWMEEIIVVDLLKIKQEAEAEVLLRKVELLQLKTQRELVATGFLLLLLDQQ
jgi:hypothetical protein